MAAPPRGGFFLLMKLSKVDAKIAFLLGIGFVELANSGGWLRRTLRFSLLALNKPVTVMLDLFQHPLHKSNKQGGCGSSPQRRYFVCLERHCLTLLANRLPSIARNEAPEREAGECIET